MQKENKEGSRARGIATIIMIIGIIAGISLYIGCWWALFAVLAGFFVWSICFSKVFAVVTGKKLKSEDIPGVGSVYVIIATIISLITNETVGIIIIGLPVVGCCLWLVWKILVVVLESLGILYTDAYDDKK